MLRHGKLSPLLHGLSRLSWRSLGPKRRIIAALLLGLTATCALTILRPSPPPTTPVVVMSRAVSPGEMLTANDVRLTAFPRQIVPDTAITTKDDAIGEVLTAPLTSGTPLTSGVLLGPALFDAGPPGTVTTPVRLADPDIAALLRAGDRIDVLLSDSQFGEHTSAQTVASGALVLASFTTSEETGLLSLSSHPSNGGLTILAVTRSEAAALAGAAQMGALSIALVK